MYTGENKRMKHTFGPVPSRRLGFSPGVGSIIEGMVEFREMYEGEMWLAYK